MNRPKIAILIDWYLPGTKAGGPVRSIYSLVNLLKNDFEFYIITTNKDLGSQQEYTNIEKNKLFNKDGVNYFYFDSKFLVSKNMFNLLNQINPALIYLNSFWSFNFSVNIIKLRGNIFKKTPILLAPRGMLSKGALSLKSFKKSVFIFLSRNLGWHKNVIFHATNQDEKSDILLKYKTEKVKVAPNLNAALPLQVNKVKEVNQLNLFFLSRVSPVKNLLFALKMLQSIPLEIKINYDIYGNIEDENYWQECLSVINNLPKNITVAHKGELKFQEVQNTICNYHFLFLPTLNENFGHSIVESLLSSCPVIISDQTPWNDCEQCNAGFALPLNNTKVFIEKLIECAKLNQEQYNLASKSSIEYISKKINISDNINAYKKLFNESINN
ncbi:MAG: glycosyltransferase [Bacteroidota bacterium]|nr:glycosyltransferase [Bacteroidota bacterium]